MVLFNYSTKELTAKVVYYGPGLCGKTTNLQFIHANLPETVKGKMLSLATKTDRTLFFDFLPLDLGTIRGMKTRIQLYTVPGQVFYNETRKLVLKGADGIVFVADSQEQMMGANVESFRNLEENLKAHGMNLAELPHVIQFNKRDLPRLAGIEEMNASINRYNAPFYESVATTGIGVQDSLKAITKLVLLHLTKKYDPKARSAQTAARPAPTPVPTPATAAPSSPGTPLDPRVAVPVSSPGAPISSPGTPIALDDAPVVPLSDRAYDEVPATIQPPSSQDRSGPPPPPDFHGTGEGGPPSFEDNEIDDLVGEVEEDTGAVAHEPPPADEPLAAGPAAMQDPVLAELPLEAGAPVETAPEPVPELGSLQDEEPIPISEQPASVDLGEFVPDAPATVSEPMDGEALPIAASGTEEPTGTGAGFEIDQGFDPEWGSGGPSMQAAPATGPETVALPPTAGIVPVQDEGDEEPADVGPIRMSPQAPEHDTEQEAVVLTEVAADDASLFDDPSLEVTRLAAGGPQEIVVPVEVGEGAERKRFKLSVTLRLDPVD